MTKTNVSELRKKLSSLTCFSERDLKKLLSYVDDIKEIISSLENRKPKNGYSLQLSYGQLLESEGYLETWVKHPKKSTMSATFREYKADFISVLDDYIKLGDKYNLWENVS